MHHDPKPKDTDSEDDASVERKKPEGSWFPPQREKGLNTSEVSCAARNICCFPFKNRVCHLIVSVRAEASCFES